MTEQDRNTRTSRGHRRSAILSLDGVQTKYLREIQGADKPQKPDRTRLERVMNATSTAIRKVVSGQEQVVPVPELGIEQFPVIETPISDAEA